MSHRSPKPIGAQDALSGTAARRLFELADWLEQRTAQLDDLLAGDSARRVDSWLAEIQPDPEPWTEVTPGWTYTVEHIDLGMVFDAGGLLDEAATMTDTDDLSLSGLAYNLREVVNTDANADGIDVSSLPGTFDMLPVSGIVRCWRQLLADGTTVIMFDVRNPIDGACE